MTFLHNLLGALPDDVDKGGVTNTACGHGNAVVADVPRTSPQSTGPTTTTTLFHR
jgi:hypothetical protein